MMHLFGMTNLLHAYIRCGRAFDGINPRVHGNGFIQLDVDPKTRLHFWGDPRIPRQRVDSGWHDHSFDLFSCVLKGRLTHITYKVHGDQLRGQFYGYRAVEQPGTQNTELKRIVHSDDVTPAKFDLVVDETFQIKEGETYGFQHGKVHYSSASEPTITLMKKFGTDGYGRPVVYCPVGLEPDNEFHRDGFSQEMLWDIVMDMVD